MKSGNILVLGSKPKSLIPKLAFKKIYTANGAAERALSYRKKNPKVTLTCLCGASEFARNFRVKRRIVKSKPERLIIRSGKIALPKELMNRTKLICLNNQDQLNFQKNFFNLKGFSIFQGEYFYHEEYLKKIFHLFKCFKNNSFQGVSTGFYSILMAIKENPDSKIIISGIGMSGGVQFYHSKRSKTFDYSPRARVDRFLMKKVDKNLKKHLFSTDKELVLNSGINLLEKNSLGQF
tara:strand:- start:1006 stop:1713 length:708 start_codon:yes stop_codon:yes gene_type:complete